VALGGEPSPSALPFPQAELTPTHTTKALLLANPCQKPASASRPLICRSPPPSIRVHSRLLCSLASTRRHAGHATAAEGNPRARPARALSASARVGLGALEPKTRSPTRTSSNGHALVPTHGRWHAFGAVSRSAPAVPRIVTSERSPLRTLHQLSSTRRETDPGCRRSYVRENLVRIRSAESSCGARSAMRRRGRDQFQRPAMNRPSKFEAVRAPSLLVGMRAPIARSRIEESRR
jgi:hypothetical protein